jgi:hypothetical protein
VQRTPLNISASVLVIAGIFQANGQQSQTDRSDIAGIKAKPAAIGTGFFISEDGFLVTNQHVVSDAVEVRVHIGDDRIPTKIVKTDPANDLALLKAQGKFTALPVVSSRQVRLGDSVATIGFPDVKLQGRSPKLTRGEINSLSGIRDDARYFQISAAVQPGNSGGALVDEHGNVIGVVCGKLSEKAALIATGALPENVNYAVKSSFLLGFLESIPELAPKLKGPNTTDVKFADVVEQARQASALVVAYVAHSTVTSGIQPTIRPDSSSNSRPPPPGGYPYATSTGTPGIYRSPYTGRAYDLRGVPPGGLTRDADTGQLFRRP